MREHRPDPDTQVDLSGYDQIAAATAVMLALVQGLTTPNSYGYVATPLGRVLVISSDEALAGVHFDAHERTPALDGCQARSTEPLMAVSRQLDEYFQGTRTRFEVPMYLEGTPFQLAVWSALLEIPYGETSTYARIAERLGRPRAARAVGAANGRNPLSIVIPCHRLVGADGGLTGYGWGVDRKRRLLELEGQSHKRRGPHALASLRSWEA